MLGGDVAFQFSHGMKSRKEDGVMTSTRPPMVADVIATTLGKEGVVMGGGVVVEKIHKCEDTELSKR